MLAKETEPLMTTDTTSSSSRLSSRLTARSSDEAVRIFVRERLHASGFKDHEEGCCLWPTEPFDYCGELTTQIIKVCADANVGSPAAFLDALDASVRAARGKQPPIPLKVRSAAEYNKNRVGENAAVLASQLAASQQPPAPVPAPAPALVPAPVVVPVPPPAPQPEPVAVPDRELVPDAEPTPTESVPPAGRIEHTIGVHGMRGVKPAALKGYKAAIEAAIVGDGGCDGDAERGGQRHVLTFVDNEGCGAGLRTLDWAAYSECERVVVVVQLPIAGRWDANATDERPPSVEPAFAGRAALLQVQDDGGRSESMDFRALGYEAYCVITRNRPKLQSSVVHFLRGGHRDPTLI